MNKPQQMQLSASRLIRQGIEAAKDNLQVLVMMASVSAIVSAVVFYDFVDILNVVTTLPSDATEEQKQAATDSLIASLGPMSLSFLTLLFVNAILLTPWARLTSPFDLMPLGRDRKVHWARVFSVFGRQVMMTLYWLLVIFISILLITALSAILPSAILSLVALIVFLVLFATLIVFSSFLNAVIISDSCLGRHAMPVTLKITRMFIRPIGGALILFAVLSFFASIFVSAVLTAIAPDSYINLVSLIISGFFNFLTVALHIAALNRIPIWQTAADELKKKLNADNIK